MLNKSNPWVWSVPTLLLFVALSKAADAPPTLKLDPVELVRGKETPGQESMAAQHGRYRYLFSSGANKAEFLKTPDRYEIQLGGACARMGPLSGEGSPDIHAVHEGRIYIFASEACKKRFVGSPEKVLDRPDPVPATNAKDLQRGKELIDLALKGFGGAERVDGLKSLRSELTATETHGDTKYRHREAWTIRFPNEFRKDDDWNDQRWAVVSGSRDAFFSGSENRAMHIQQRAALEKDFYRSPLVILRNRTRPDFVAVATGSGSVNETPVEFLTVAFAGATTKLGIDPKSGRILGVQYRGRGSDLMLGDLELTYGDYRSIDGIDLPHSVMFKVDGNRVPKMDKVWTTLAINEPLEESLFLPGK